jgi:hypothetical protein
MDLVSSSRHLTVDCLVVSLARFTASNHLSPALLTRPLTQLTGSPVFFLDYRSSWNKDVVT